MQNKQEWLDARRKGITGSDVAAILGLSPWRTALEVYLDKKKLAKDIEQNEAMYFGNLLENIVAEEYAKRVFTSISIEHNMLQHPEHSWMLANIDRWVDNKRYILECKTTAHDFKKAWGEPGTNQIPVQYLCQVAWYAAVCDVQRVDIAVLIGGNDFRIYRYNRDLSLEEQVINACKSFWFDNVVANVAPEPKGLSDVKMLYRQDAGTKITADESTLITLNELKATKQQIKALTEYQNELQQALFSYMQDNSYLCDANGNVLATWKTSKPRITLDTNRFRAEQPELYSEYQKESEGTRALLIKETTNV